MRAALAFAPLLFLAACDDMREQPRYDPFEASALFDNGRVAQDPVPGTVAFLPPDPVAESPEAGAARFAAVCAPCHGLTGHGDGPAAGRTVPAPPSFHQDRLRALSPAEIARIIERGIGRMAPHALQVPPAERLAVAGFVKALQAQGAPD